MMWSHLTGVWAVDPDWLALHRAQLEAFLARSDPAEIEAARRQPADLGSRADDMAIIAIHGPMLKHAGFWAELFGYSSTTRIRQAVLAAAHDETVSGIMLHVESPGGHVAGVQELSQAVKMASNQKPVHAHIEDIGASAAYWASAHASRITANPMAEVGSLAAMAVVADTSALYAQQGVKVHVISRASHKGVGVNGTELTEEGLQDIEKRVLAVDRFFMDAVRRGREFTSEQLSAVNDGRVFIASEAKALGLVDEVRSFDTALAELGRAVSGSTGRAQRRAQLAHVSKRMTSERRAVNA